MLNTTLSNIYELAHLILIKFYSYNMTTLLTVAAEFVALISMNGPTKFCR